MASVIINSFGGVSPKTPPRLLRQNQAQIALNSGVFTGTLTPIKDLGTSVASVSGATQTIYKFGQDSTDPTFGWLSFPNYVDLARSQIAGDTEEWTFYTGDGFPKAIRAGSLNSPIPLGLGFPTTKLSTSLGTEPEDAENLVQETRVYTYTYVYKVGAREIESAPAPPSDTVDVYPDQTVSLSGFTTPASPYVATHVRIYRSTAGIFLFVNELPIATATGSGYVDDIDPDDLAEEIPSLGWLPPPDDMKGLINLPNGIMAGFVSRDIFFCEPYVPHAWPDTFRQTIDYPIVGLGRMDTTLAVLTKGTPYLIQGSHPDAMVVVKSDVEQACMSKESIVSFNGSVFYCSPDGLIMLTPGGSKLITENMFTYTQWQALIKPESVHAYHQDMKYIAFYDNGTTAGCFVYDTITNEFTFNTLLASAGYQSLRDDTLYLLRDGNIRPWNEGANTTYTWKSKVHTMPRVMGMSVAQVEAENYPVEAKIFLDGQLLHTQEVTNRFPFRLPAKSGRDWEIQVVGQHEVFSVAIAQSMEELANA